MAQIPSTPSIASLRATTFRLASTPTKQLPHIAPQIAVSLWNCRDVLSVSSDTSKTSNETVTLVHRFRTSLSSLLQDRTVEGRWAAVVLVKAAIEAGGIEFLNKSNAWVRNLLAILKKPDPPTTRNLAVITLTRIYVLTWEYSNLIREITTPTLPMFISSCLSNLEKKHCSASELQTILEAFASLILRHPTIFRTHETQIRSVILQVLSGVSLSSGSGMHYTRNHKHISQRLLVLLHHTAPRQAAGEKWDETLKITISAAHATCELIFRAVAETWVPKADTRPVTHYSTSSLPDPELEDEDAIGLGGWTGIFAGSDRLVTMLGILQMHLETATAGVVTIRLGALVDLIDRMFSVTLPRREASLKFNNEISKEERESMFSILPGIHSSAIELVTTLFERFGVSAMSIVQSLMESIVGVFSAEMPDVNVRTATFRTTKLALELVGPSMPREDVSELAIIMKACCDDLLSVTEKATSIPGTQSNDLSQKQQLTRGDLHLQASKTRTSHPTTLNDLQSAAEALLPVIITKLNPAHVPRKLRVQMERTAILTRHKDALVACVMNPAKKDNGAEYKASLLPFLAREYPETPEVEALLRPRMPPIVTNISQGDQDDFEVDEEGDYGVVGGAQNGATTGDQDVLDDIEPTTGLLNALGENRSLEQVEKADEDLYSASPRKNQEADTDVMTGEQHNAIGTERQTVDQYNKRPAAEPANGETSAKRLRASPIAEALVADSREPVPGPDPVSVQTSVPISVSLEQPTDEAGSSEQIATLPAPPPAALSTDDVGFVGDGGSDGSDFEMPPLTMESDTDPEEEEEEDELGEEG